MHLPHDLKLNTALALLRQGGECFGPHNLRSTASAVEWRAGPSAELDCWGILV